MASNNEFLRFISENLNRDNKLEKIFNWDEISKIPLDMEFMKAHTNVLNWDLVSQYQTFDLNTIQTFENRINYDLLVKNSNLSEDVLKTKSDKMDWKMVQMHQRLTPALLDHFADQVDPATVLRYQKLQPQYISKFLKTPMERRQLPIVKAMFDITLEYQKVPEDMVVDFLNYEREINPSQVAPVSTLSVTVPSSTVVHSEGGVTTTVPTSTSGFPGSVTVVPEAVKPEPRYVKPDNYITLVNMELVLKHQTVSTNFMRKYVDTPELLGFACQFQKFTPELITYLISDPSRLNNMGSKLLRYQKLTVDSIKDPVFMTWLTSNIQNIATFVKYQNYDLETFQKLISTVTVDESVRNKTMRPFYNMVLLRTLHSPVHPEYLNWSIELIDKEVVPNVNWEAIVARTDDQTLTLEQCDTLIKFYGKYVPWYSFVKHNDLTEDQLNRADKSEYVGAIHWWIILTNKRPKRLEFSDKFLKEHQGKQKWWNYIPKDMVPKFYQDCLEVIQLSAEGDNHRNNLKTFLNDFVEKADWGNILRYENLDEWFIRIFQNFAGRIDKGYFWWKIARYQKLTTGFMKRHMEELSGHINVLLGYQKVTPEFLVEYAPFFDDDAWDKVRKYQKDVFEQCPAEWRLQYQFAMQ